MRRLWTVVLAVLLGAPVPARASIRTVDLRTGRVRTLAAARRVAPLAWRARSPGSARA